MCCLLETHSSFKDIHILKVKRWKKYSIQTELKEAEVAILTSVKTDFKPKPIKRDKESHYIMIKRSIHQEDKTFVNSYAPNLET